MLASSSHSLSPSLFPIYTLSHTHTRARVVHIGIEQAEALGDGLPCNNLVTLEQIGILENEGKKRAAIVPNAVSSLHEHVIVVDFIELHNRDRTAQHGSEDDYLDGEGVKG